MEGGFVVHGCCCSSSSNIRDSGVVCCLFVVVADVVAYRERERSRERERTNINRWENSWSPSYKQTHTKQIYTLHTHIHRHTYTTNHTRTHNYKHIHNHTYILHNIHIDILAQTNARHQHHILLPHTVPRTKIGHNTHITHTQISHYRKISQISHNQYSVVQQGHQNNQYYHI